MGLTLALPSFGIDQQESACLPVMTSKRGLGTAQQTNQVIGLTSTGVATAGAIISSPALLGTAAIPIAGPFIAAAAALIPIIASFFQGCGNTCIVATQVVNNIEPYLQQNLAAYQALPIPRTQAEQQAALAVFDSAWAQVTSPQGCGNPALDGAGQRCISERGPGGSIPNHPGVNWFTLYRDPIANDPNVASGTSVSELVSGSGVSNLANSAVGVVSGVTGINPLWIALGAIVVGAVVFFTGDGSRKY